MNKIEGVILDWAGTTVDFGCFAPVNVFLEIFKQAGVEATVEEARLPMGMLKKDHIRAMLKMSRIDENWKQKYGRESCEEDVETLYMGFEPLLLEQLRDYTEPLPHVIDAVARLREMGIKIGSTTGYTDSMMEIVVEGAREKGYQPDYIITPDSTGSKGRPFPYMIYRNIEALGITASWKTVKVGDTISDIQEGSNAGVWTVGVMVGSSQLGLSKKEYQTLGVIERHNAIDLAEYAFVKAGADFTIETLEELPGLIVEINRLIADRRRPKSI